MPGTLNHDTFAARLNELFTVALGSTSVDLTLAECTRLTATAAPGETFSLIFHGPVQSPLPQQIYTLQHPALGEIDIFLVPLGPAGSAFQYQAIFS